MRSGKTPQEKSALLFFEEAELKPTESVVYFWSGYPQHFILSYSLKKRTHSIMECVLLLVSAESRSRNGSFDLILLRL